MHLVYICILGNMEVYTFHMTTSYLGKAYIVSYLLTKEPTCESEDSVKNGHESTVNSGTPPSTPESHIGTASPCEPVIDRLGNIPSAFAAIVRPPSRKYICEICNKSHNCRKSMRHCSHPTKDTELADIMSQKKRKKDSDYSYRNYVANVHKRRRRGFN